MSKVENKVIDEDVKVVDESTSKEDLVTKGKKDIDAIVSKRGFKSYKSAEEYINSEAFNKLCESNKVELLSWFEKIK